MSYEWYAIDDTCRHVSHAHCLACALCHYVCTHIKVKLNNLNRSNMFDICHNPRYIDPSMSISKNVVFLKLFQLSNWQAALPFESWWQVGMVQIWTQIPTKRWVVFLKRNEAETPRREGCSCGGGNVLPKSIRREWLQELTAQTQLNASEVGFMVLWCANDFMIILCIVKFIRIHGHIFGQESWSHNASCQNMPNWIRRCSKLSWRNLEDIES